MSFINDAKKEQLERPEYLSDIKRIRSVADNHGVDLTLKQAETAWILYSEMMAAGWMSLPEDDDDLWNSIS